MYIYYIVYILYDIFDYMLNVYTFLKNTGSITIISTNSPGSHQLHSKRLHNYFTGGKKTNSPTPHTSWLWRTQNNVMFFLLQIGFPPSMVRKITICFRVGISPFSPAFFVGSFRPGATKPDKYTAAVSPVVNNTCIGKRILSRKKQERAQHKFKGMEDWPIFCLFLTSQAVIWPNWNQPKSNLRATCQLRGQFPNSSAMPSILGPRDYEYDLLSFRILLSISLTKI